MARLSQKANKKATKGKGKLWKKGQSSCHNPEFNKHRQAAKKRAFYGNEGSSNLTIAQVEQHNKMQLEIDPNIADDVKSIGVVTGLTGFTNCSLPTFNRLLKNWNSNSFLHVKMRAALEAIAQVIKDKGEEESEAKYFSLLVLMLDSFDCDETLTAVICLLSMVVKKMNKSTLIGLQKSILPTFTDLLKKYMKSDHCALLRNLLSIVFAFIKVKTSWSEKNDEIEAILKCATHHKPKVRKMAQSIISNLLLVYQKEKSSTHPCAMQIANFCVEKLENKSSDSRDVFYILNLLRETLSMFPVQNIKKACETIIKVMTLSNTMVTSSCLKALKGVFSTKASENLSTDLNAKIISAMYPYQPNIKEAQCLIDWLQLMESAFTNLYKLNQKLCISHLPNFFMNAVKCWLSEREDVMQVVSITLNNLIHVCIDPSSEAFQGFLFDDPINNPMHKTFYHVEEALSYQYHKAWKCVIFVLSGFFEVMGKNCHTVMMKCLHSLADLHDSFKFPHKVEIERTLGVAIEHMGPRIVLSAIPLQIGEERPDFPRSWLLPLLRDYIKNTELEFFCRYFLGLSKKMKDRALKLKQEEKVVECKLFEVIYSQIWSLLPGFCTGPTDLEKIFVEERPGTKGLPRILAEALKFEPPIRLNILHAIRLLVTRNMENEKHLEVLSKFANNYLLVFFNLYAPENKDTVEEKVRLATYETIKVYLQITKPEIVENLFKKAMEKLSLETDTFKQIAIVDIAKTMLPYVKEELISQLYEYAKPLLTHSNHTLQKKAFGVVKEICSCSSESCQAFVKNNRNSILSVLNIPVMSLPPSTKALRLNCLKCMVSQLTPEEIKCVEVIIPEAALSTKEISKKAREAAYELLIEIGHTLKRLMPGDSKESLKYYVFLLMGGISGPPRMISATILAIGRVLYEFKTDIESNLTHQLIENICLLLSSKCREVVVSALSFLKIIFAIVDSMTLSQHMGFLIQSISNISEDNQRHFRFKAKEIFTRSIRKFGYEMISKLVPEKYQKQLNNIRKTEARRQRKKETKNIDSEDEDNFPDKTSKEFDDLLADLDEEIDFEEEKMHVVKEPKRHKMNAPYLEEHDENDIVDFMDPSANKRLTSMPTKETSQTKKSLSSFPVAEDGRIIIQDEEDEEKSKTKKTEEDKPSFKDLIKKSKRKHEDSDDDADEPSSKMSEVKKGIHRTLQPKAKRKCAGDEFKAKKAGGDVKKGKLEPFAYVPFNKQSLNKRKQVKFKGQFKNIVKAAKKGATIGMKRKARNSKKRKN